MSTAKQINPKRRINEMTNSHHKYIVYATLEVKQDDGTWREHTFNRLCNNEKTRDQTLRRWAKAFEKGTFLYGRQFKVVKCPWAELR